ncbi:Uncharacterised protein [Nocardia africana]|uniref:Uncharacterized protein n=2 Tax=Nocardia africana TaxID=134964 RepID=A0A378WIA7_9NOCA|nr:Uncharacterised protein [Nocardia africana]
MPAGGDEPEHPAPSITPAAAGSDDDHAGMASGSDKSGSDESDSDDTARWLGGIGLVLGALGAALGLGSLIRSRRA